MEPETTTTDETVLEPTPETTDPTYEIVFPSTMNVEGDFSTTGQVDTLINQNAEIIDMLLNLTSGLQFVIYILVAFLLWQVIKIIYNLFAGVILGGL